MCGVSGFRASGFWVRVLGFQGLGFRGFGVEDLGFRVLGLRMLVKGTVGDLKVPAAMPTLLARLLSR